MENNQITPMVNNVRFWVGCSAVVVVLAVVVAFSFHVTHSKSVQSQAAAVASAQNSSSTPMNALYSYALPTGWEYVPNSGEGEQADNQTSHYVFSVVTVSLPAGLSGTTSIDQMISPSQMNQVIQSEFPGATVSSTTLGVLDGEKAIITAFTASVVETASDGSEKSSKPLSLLQYNAIHKGTSYTLVLINGDQTQTGLPADFQKIINSFKFK